MTTSMRGCSAGMQKRKYFCGFSNHFHVQLLILLQPANVTISILAFWLHNKNNTNAEHLMAPRL